LQLKIVWPYHTLAPPIGLTEMTRKLEDSRPAHEAAIASRRAAFRLGLSAELLAAGVLRIKGYRIVARRFRTAVGEADIVARRGNDLVFVEVKAREALDEAAEAVLPRQQRRIIAAARAWLARHPDDAARNIRFDVVLVAPRRLPRHLKAAFEER
jgi:putative endonuclease